MYIDENNSDEIEDLQEEIKYLEKRISNLEKNENRRKAVKYIKIIAKIIFYGLIVYLLWRGYDYVVNGIPDMLNEKIQSLNPFKK